MGKLGELKEKLLGKKDKEDIKKIPPKIYVGNAKINEHHMSATLDLTVLVEQEEYFNVANIAGDEHFMVDVTLLPFKKGTNQFGNTHYIIIKNK